LLVVLGLGASAIVRAQHTSRAYVVVVHPDNPASSVSRRFLSDAFLKRRTRWGHGEQIRPVDLETSSAVRRSFSEDVMSRSPMAVRSYWQRIIFSGRGVPPVEVDDDAAAVRYVLRHRGGIAYVSGSADVGRAKIVSVR
jgi:hypothetical protein